MKLPKKYQGVTPGTWLREELFIYALTPYTGDAKFARSLPDGVNRFQCQVSASGRDGASREEQLSNATIMADSPRLAAAVVADREVFDTIIRRLQADIEDGSRPDQWSMEALVQKCKDRIASTSEWVV